MIRFCFGLFLSLLFFSNSYAVTYQELVAKYDEMVTKKNECQTAYQNAGMRMGSIEQTYTSIKEEIECNEAASGYDFHPVPFPGFYGPNWDGSSYKNSVKAQRDAALNNYNSTVGATDPALPNNFVVANGQVLYNHVNNQPDVTKYGHATLAYNAAYGLAGTINSGSSTEAINAAYAACTYAIAACNACKSQCDTFTNSEANRVNSMESIRTAASNDYYNWYNNNNGY